MGYDQFYLGWREEDTAGTSKITGAGDTAYKVGSVDRSTPLFDPDWEYIDTGTDWGERKTAGYIKTIPKVFASAFAFLPNNGVPIWWVLGKSSTAGTVHTLTTQSQASGIIPELPSVTFHAERIDSAGVLTDWPTQYKGMKNVMGRFICGDDQPLLMCVYGVIGMSVAKPAFVLTTKPVNVTGTHTSPINYKWAGCTHKYDSTTVEGVKHFEINVENGTFATPPQYGSQWPESVYQGPKQLVTLLIRYRPQELTFHDDLLAQAVTTKDWEFEFVRHATDDKLKFTCKDCSTVYHTLLHPVSADEYEIEMVFVVDELEVTVTDQIASSFYGE